MQNAGELMNQMYYGLAVDFGVGSERRGLEKRGLAFRGGHSFRGYGRPIRDADPGALLKVDRVAGTAIEVRWLPEISWRKRIRYSDRA